MLTGGAKRCTYEHCDSLGGSSRFYKIESRTTARGHDFGSIAGNVLCKTCYDRFRRRGTLERKKNRPLPVSARRCTYAGCDSPCRGTRFHRIEEGRTSGGQDWSPLVGSVLCKKCFDRYRARGTLERTVNRPLPASERHCTYELCESPGESRHFYQVEEGKSSGGQDWSPIVGSVLCTSCYNRYSRTGTLHRSDSRNSKRHKPFVIPLRRRQQQQPPPLQTSISAGTSISDGENETSELEHDEDTGECMECLEGLEPCHHLGLYMGCGDDDLFGAGGSIHREGEDKDEN